MIIQILIIVLAILIVASIMMQHIMSTNIGPGAFPIEKALTGHEFYNQAMKRNYTITVEEK